MATVTATQLGAYLNRTVNTAQADAVIGVVTAMAFSYTRGRGWSRGGLPATLPLQLGDVPAPDIAAVILSASARMISNTTQLDIAETYGPQSRSVRGAFVGWSVAELFCLNRYRTRAA
jgi:hypothetical protein